MSELEAIWGVFYRKTNSIIVFLSFIFGRLFACAKTRLSACIFFLLLQKSRSASPHVEGCCITVVHGWTGFYSATSLTFRQTRYQALYMDIQRLIADTASILCRSSKMYIRVHFWLRVSDKAETSLLRGTSNIRAASELTSLSMLGRGAVQKVYFIAFFGCLILKQS